jgi:polyhydroxyalkanoate synthesis regulator phasin
MKYEDWERYENERLAKSGEKRRRIFTTDELAEKLEKLEEEVAALKNQLRVDSGEVQVLEAWNETRE